MGNLREWEKVLWKYYEDRIFSRRNCPWQCLQNAVRDKNASARGRVNCSVKCLMYSSTETEHNISRNGWGPKETGIDMGTDGTWITKCKWWVWTDAKYVETGRNGTMQTSNTYSTNQLCHNGLEPCQIFTRVFTLNRCLLIYGWHKLGNFTGQ